MTHVENNGNYREFRPSGFRYAIIHVKQCGHDINVTRLL